jgi:hypothetical protein
MAHPELGAQLVQRKVGRATAYGYLLIGRELPTLGHVAGGAFGLAGYVARRNGGNAQRFGAKVVMTR